MKSGRHQPSTAVTHQYGPTVSDPTTRAGPAYQNHYRAISRGQDWCTPAAPASHSRRRSPSAPGRMCLRSTERLGSTGMDLAQLQQRATAISELYDRHNAAAGRNAWTTADLALGFVGDVGDLAKLVMAVDGRREMEDARERLGHELADCLWSVLVLADRYGIDLAAEFAHMTDAVDAQLG